MPWTNLSFPFGTVLTSAQMTNLFNNFAAVANGDTGAPRIQTAAIQDSAITTAKIADGNVTFSDLAQPCVSSANIFDLNVTNTKLASNSITSSKIVDRTILSTDIGISQVNVDNIGPNAVHQSELNVVSSFQSWGFSQGISGGTFRDTVGNTYTFTVRGYTTLQPTYLSLETVCPTGTYPTVQMFARTSSAGTGTMNSQERYVGASPPYDLGDGQFGYFIFALLDKQGNIKGTYMAEDPPWAYNGSSRMMIDYKSQDDKTLTQFVEYQDMSGHPRTLKQCLESDNPNHLMDYLIAFQNAKTIKVEADMEYKNRGMKEIPHPFVDEVKQDPSLSVVMLDPFCPLAETVMTGGKHYDFPFKEIMERLDFKSVLPKRKAPPGVFVCDGRLK